MSNEQIEQSNDSILIRFGNGVISFIVGLSAFYVIKLIFMIPINMMATPESIDLMKGVGAWLTILAIYLAVKYTKKLNRSGARKTRNIKRIVTIVFGAISMFVTTMFLALTGAL